MLCLLATNHSPKYYNFEINRLPASEMSEMRWWCARTTVVVVITRHDDGIWFRFHPRASRVGCGLWCTSAPALTHDATVMKRGSEDVPQYVAFAYVGRKVQECEMMVLSHLVLGAYTVLWNYAEASVVGTRLIITKYIARKLPMLVP